MKTLHNIIGLLCSLCWIAAIYALCTATPDDTAGLFFSLANACLYSFIFLVTAPKEKEQPSNRLM